MYQFIFDYLFNLLKNNYYDLKIKNNTLNTTNYFKFEYFLFIKFYFIYSFLCHLKHKNFLLYSIYLYLQKISGELCMELNNHYSITSENNIDFLYQTSNHFFNLLLFCHIYFSKNIYIINKFFIILNISLFKLGNITQKMYKKRIKCIENGDDFEDNFDFLFLIPNMENINKTLLKTKFMNDNNFYVFIHFILFIFY